MNINVNYIHVNVPNNIQSSYMYTHTNMNYTYKQSYKLQEKM